MMKLCDRCGSILQENNYFGKWICITCDYEELIKNDLYIKKITDSRPNSELIIRKLNEIIDVINKITNPRV